MESTITEKMLLRNISPSEQPPFKIKVTIEKDTTTWINKLWN